MKESWNFETVIECELCMSIGHITRIVGILKSEGEKERFGVGT